MMLAVAMSLGMLLGTRLDDQLPLVAKQKVPKKVNDPWGELKNTIGFIQSRYGDTLDIESINHEAIELLVSKLDPHSYYLSGADYQSFKERMMGSYVGIGIDYDLIRDTVYLLKVIKNSPAADAGLLPGDQILQINNKATSGAKLSREQVYDLWRSAGNQVVLNINRFGNDTLSQIEIFKGDVSLESVPYATMIDDESGYIKVSRFARNTFESFMSHLETLSEKGLENLIIDLRNNPGGSLDQVIRMLNQLVPDRNQLLLYTEGEHSRKVEYKTTGKTLIDLDQIAVIINENSVSASEVLAGVLQDLGRAIVVGRRSYGKALVQEMYDLSEESAINLTIARYYLPSGRFIQRSYGDRKSYDKEVKHRTQSGELFSADSLVIDSAKLVPASDGTLRPTGEGVIPDVFVPADSFYLSEAWKKKEYQIYLDAFDLYNRDKKKIYELISGDSISPGIKALIQTRPKYQETIADLDPVNDEQWSMAYTRILMYHALEDEVFLDRTLLDEEEIRACLEAFSSHH